MSVLVHYGLDQSLSLELPAEVEPLVCSAPRGEPPTDARAAALAALRRPVGYPPLVQCAVPGDKVAFALDAGVPRAAAVVAAAVEELLARGVSAEDIAIVRTAADREAGAEDPRVELPPKLAGVVQLEEHRGDDRRQLIYLAADQRGDEIYLNRRIGDADLVITVGCLRLKPTAGYYGLSGGVFPAFADDKQQLRIRGLELSDLRADAPPAKSPQARAQQEADQVRWLLGAQFAVAVVPGAADDALHVVAGEHERVEEQATSLAARAWQFELPRPADLVIAALGGGPPQQQWTEVGRALAAAQRAMAEGGAIALCTDLAVPPGDGLRQVLRTDDRDAALRRVRKKAPADAVAAAQTAAALAGARVYLLSRLPSDEVEDLGLTPVASAAELSRLCRRHETIAILENAQHIRPLLT